LVCIEFEAILTYTKGTLQGFALKASSLLMFWYLLFMLIVAINPIILISNKTNVYEFRNDG